VRGGCQKYPFVNEIKNGKLFQASRLQNDFYLNHFQGKKLAIPHFRGRLAERVYCLREIGENLEE
jgi:hypothetical protein